MLTENIDLFIEYYYKIKNCFKKFSQNKSHGYFRLKNINTFIKSTSTWRKNMYFPFDRKKTSVKELFLINQTSLNGKKLFLTKIIKKSRTLPLILVAIITIIATNAVADDENIFMKGWPAMTKNHILRLIAENTYDNITAVAWSPDGKLIATAGGLPTDVVIWDAASLAIRKQLDQGERGHGDDNITFSPDGQYLASGLKIINVWKVADGTRQATLVAPHITPGIPQEVGIISLRFSPDGKMFVVVYGGKKKIVIAYLVANMGIAWSYEPQKTTLFTTPLVSTPDGKYVIMGEGELIGPHGHRRWLPKILILDAETGRFLRSIDNIHTDNPTALAISPDGKWVATGTTTGTIHDGPEGHVENKDPVRIWNLETGKLVKELPVQSRVWSLAFSRDGKYLFGAKSQIHTNLTLAVWDIKSGKMVQEVKNDPGPTNLAVSPDGRRLAAACDNKLSIYEITEGN
jgi:WD40 repeat protein